MADPRNPSTDTESRGLVSRVTGSATKQLTAQKDRAADGIGSVTQALRQSTQHLRDDQHETIAQYVERAADQIDRWCDRVREKDVTEVFDDVQQLARRRPAVFVGSAFALGLLGARFLKSSRDSDGARRSSLSSGNRRAEYRGSRAIAEAADAPSISGGVSVSDVPAPSRPAPPPATGGASGTRARRSANKPSGTQS